MNRLRNFFIGKYLSTTDDVFEMARIIMLFRFTLAFSILFILPVIGDYIMGLHKAIIKHSIDLLLITGLLFSFRYGFPINKVINFFFGLTLISYQVAFMMLNPMKLDVIALLWSAMFLSLSAMLQRGKARLAYCLFTGWIPILYVIFNIKLNGALTIDWIAEKMPDIEPPIFLIFLPIVMLIIAVWSNSNTVEVARKTITLQKKVIEERNKEITDSIHYAKRIQQSLLPTEKYISKNLNKKDKVN